MITSPRISTSSPGSGGSAIIVRSNVSPTQALANLSTLLLAENTERLLPTGNSVTIDILQPIAIAGLPVPCLTAIKVERINNFAWQVVEGSYNIIGNLTSVVAGVSKNELKQINSENPTGIKVNFLPLELKPGNLYRAKLIWDLTGTFFTKNNSTINSNRGKTVAIKTSSIVDQLIPEKGSKSIATNNLNDTKKIPNKNPEIKKAITKQKSTPTIVETYHSEDEFYFFIGPITNEEIENKFVNSMPATPSLAVINIHHNES